MNFLKQCLTATLLLLSLFAIAQRSYSANETDADSSWSNLNKLIVFYSSTESFTENQIRLLKYRENGLKFWNQFPTDSRRYQWLFNTVVTGASIAGITYWDINDKDESYTTLLNKRLFISSKTNYSWPLQKQLLDKWELIYPQLRDEFLLYCSQNPNFELKGDPTRCGSNEISLLGQELFQFLFLSLNLEYRKNKKMDLDKLFMLLNLSTKYLAKENSSIPTQKQKTIFNPLNSIINRYEIFGLEVKDLSKFLNRIKASSCPVIKNWAIQQSVLFSLKKMPLVLKHVSTTGDTIELAKMRGKVILVDFWSTYCSSCIARMPAIKKIYDKYRSEGFEVISVCLADLNEITKVKSIDDKIEANWPLLLIGNTSTKNSLGQLIWRKYGFWSVPQMLLLNKQGKLVMHNNLLASGDFEPIVKHLLAEEYK